MLITGIRIRGLTGQINNDPTILDLFSNIFLGTVAFSVTSVDGDNSIFNNQVVSVLGSGFGTEVGVVYIDDVQQSINSWADDEIEITVARGPLNLGTHSIRVFKPI